MALRTLLIIFGVIAIAAGLAGLVALKVGTPSRNGTIVTPVEPEQPGTVHVLQARRAVAGGAFFTASDLAWVEIEAPAPLEAFVGLPAGEMTVVGGFAIQDIAKGDVILVDHVLRPSDGGFLAAVLSPGMRAMSISPAAARGIFPGDRVDVVLTQVLAEDDGLNPRKAVAETILQDRRVIAVDGTDAITLEVDASEAQILSVATRIGTLTVLGRGRDQLGGPGDLLPPPASWASDASSALAKPGKDQARTPRRSGPIILRGGKDPLPLED